MGHLCQGSGAITLIPDRSPLLNFLHSLVITISDSTSTHLACLSRCQWCRKYKSEKHSEKFSNHHWDLDLEHSQPILSWNTSAYDAVPSIVEWSLDAKAPTVHKIQKVWMQKNQQFTRYWRNDHILIMQALAVTLTLKTGRALMISSLALLLIIFRVTVRQAQQWLG